MSVREITFARRYGQLPEITIPTLEAQIGARGGDIISLAVGSPHRDDLPGEKLLSHLQDVMAEYGNAALGYPPVHGVDELLEVLGTYLGDAGLDAGPERLAITSGAMPALDFMFRMLLDPGDLIVIEKPTYPDVVVSLSTYDVQIAELPCDENGARVEELPELIAGYDKKPKMIYVMPTFQNPGGRTMSLERRERLLELADEWGSIVLEDDPYSPFRYAGEELPALGSLSNDVITVRSFSKIVAPGLRIGAVVAPSPVIDTLANARAGNDICTNALGQYAVARFVADGLAEHVTSLTAKLQTRREAVIAALSDQLGDLGATWTEPDGGMFVWLELPEDIDTIELLPLAVEEGIAYVPGRVFCNANGLNNALRLCYAPVDEAGLAEAVARLRRAVDKLRG